MNKRQVMWTSWYCIDNALDGAVNAPAMGSVFPPNVDPGFPPDQWGVEVCFEVPMEDVGDWPYAAGHGASICEAWDAAWDSVAFATREQLMP